MSGNDLEAYNKLQDEVTRLRAVNSHLQAKLDYIVSIARIVDVPDRHKEYQDAFQQEALAIKP